MKNKTELAARYAKAIYDLAAEGQMTDVAMDFLMQTSTALVTPAHIKFFQNPSLEKAKQKDVMDAVLEALKAPQLLRDFTYTLIDARRVALMPLIAKAFRKIKEEAEDSVHLIIHTAQDLSESAQSDLQKDLTKFAGKTVSAQFLTDPKLLGGMTIRMGSYLIDSSLQNKLEQFQTIMKEEGKRA